MFCATVLYPCKEGVSFDLAHCITACTCSLHTLARRRGRRWRLSGPQ